MHGLKLKLTPKRNLNTPTAKVFARFFLLLFCLRYPPSVCSTHTHSIMAGHRIASILLVALATLLSTAWAGQDFRGQIQPNAELGHLVNLGPNTRVLLHAIPPEASTASTEDASDSTIGSNAAKTNVSFDLAAFGQQRDRSTLVGVDGSFIFRDLPQGAYTLEIVSRSFMFEQYRIDILDPALGKAPQIRIYAP